MKLLLALAFLSFSVSALAADPTPVLTCTGDEGTFKLEKTGDHYKTTMGFVEHATDKKITSFLTNEELTCEVAKDNKKIFSCEGTSPNGKVLNRSFVRKDTMLNSEKAVLIVEHYLDYNPEDTLNLPNALIFDPASCKGPGNSPVEPESFSRDAIHLANILRKCPSQIADLSNPLASTMEYATLLRAPGAGIYEIGFEAGGMAGSARYAVGTLKILERFVPPAQIHAADGPSSHMGYECVVAKSAASEGSEPQAKN